MPDSLQQQYDDAMFAFSQGEYDKALEVIEQILSVEPAHLEARLALGMAWCRKGDLARAIAAGHEAERLWPDEQLVHTNLSLFYVKAGDKTRAEHHGLKARIASWKGNMTAPAPGSPPSAVAAAETLPQAAPAPAPVKLPAKFPDMPWKKKNAPSQTTPAAPAPPLAG